MVANAVALGARLAIDLCVTFGALSMIKRGLEGPHQREVAYGPHDVLIGCLALFALFLAWAWGAPCQR